jgi:hypothetical protein
MRKYDLLGAAAALVLLTGLAPPAGQAPEVAGPVDEEAEAATAQAPEPAARPVAEKPKLAPRPAVGTEFFYSSDSNGTEVARAALDFDLRNSGENHYLAVRAEKARYKPSGAGWQSRDRVFVRAAGDVGKWQAKASVGTDGHSIIGSVSVNDTAPVRKELFVDRDIVETRQGLARGIYSTFAGVAIDLPVNDRNSFTALAGVQAFTGDNVRLHLRGSYIHVLAPELGLSAQLRARYFHSSDPGEFDYYSPRWYAEVLPVLQMRRFVRGWELVGAGGLGVQRDAATDWRTSRYAHARLRHPLGTSPWSVNGAFTYTNTPSTSAASRSGYSYVQFNFGVSRRF